MNIKKKLIFVRGKHKLVLDQDGDSFNASFDINSIGGILTFNLPYIKTSSVTDTNFRVDRLKRFDYVFLYFAEVEGDQPPEQWYKIFNGYIESINLRKTKNSISYTFQCNCMLALSNYYYYGGGKTIGGTHSIVEMPYKILQTANMQAGPGNTTKRERVKNVIPQEVLDVQLNKVFAEMSASTIVKNTCKEAIDEFRNKYGLIFTENMDGTVQITTLTNYLTEAGNYEFLYDMPDRKMDPEEHTGNWLTRTEKVLSDVGDFMFSFMYHQLGRSEQLEFADPVKQEKHINRTLKMSTVCDWAYNNVIRKFRPIINEKGEYTLPEKTNLHELYLDEFVRSGQLELVDAFGEFYDTGFQEVKNVPIFSTDNNIFDITYPDVNSEYDGVVVYGIGRTGKAIDLTAVALKGIVPDEKGNYNINMLKLYRRDIHVESTLNKIAREELYKIKQENKVKFTTHFSPTYKVGMAFTIDDEDRYDGTDLFVCTKLSYTISKNNVSCVIEGMSSILSLLPQKIVSENVRVSDVSHLGIHHKIKDTNWENIWQS